jgi:hypothetical protein
MFRTNAPDARPEVTTNRPSRWRMRTFALLAGLMMLVSTAVVAPATPAQAAGNPAPKWLVDFVGNRAGDQAQGILEAFGYNCLTEWVCWNDTSYDPPRWFYYGVVQTGLGSNGYLRARGWPGTDSRDPVIRTFPENWKLVIFCQTHGPTVNGRWGPTNVWDYVGHYGEAPMFVSDGFVYTGTNLPVAGDCGATNMGDNP